MTNPGGPSNPDDYWVGGPHNGGRDLGEYRPPREADLLDSRQRRALDELIRSIVAAKGATDEDQDEQDPQRDPPADGEAGSGGAPMTVTHLDDHRARTWTTC